MGGGRALGEKERSLGLPYVGQSLQLPALIIRDDTIHHHPLGAVQDFGVHGELDAFIEQGATCKAMTRPSYIQQPFRPETLHHILLPCKEQTFQLFPVHQRNHLSGHFQRLGLSKGQNLELKDRKSQP